MKKVILAFVFALSLALAFSIATLAADLENTYYVVQSEASELADSLRAEGKNVVGIERLYATKEAAQAQDSTYFVSQFDGMELNLILAENVSYCMSTNPSNPWGSGIRLDKAVKLNVYFSGHYWWIPDDNRYAGFFINNQNAHLTLIGERTLEEVSATFNLSSVNAKTTSSLVDFYGGYIGFYLENGDLTIKNAVIIGEDEVIYQKDANASGKSTVTLDTCLINNKDKSCRTIHLRSEGRTDITVKFNRLYADYVSINNIVDGGYIKDSKINSFYNDSWHEDSLIGKEYLYISDSVIGTYLTVGDTLHPIAVNTTFGKIDLRGDTSGGAYATLINSTYTELNLVRRVSGAKTNGVLYVVTPADCESASARTVYTYDDSLKAVVTFIDEEYSKNNPAKGHISTGELLSISYESYFEYGDCKRSCSVCGVEYFERGVASPLLISCGYASSEFGKAGVAAGFEANVDAITEYEKATGVKINYGVFAVAKSKLGSNDIFDKDGQASSGVIDIDITGYGVKFFEIKVVGFSEAQKNEPFATGAYIKVSNGDETVVFYLQDEEPKENEKYQFISYNSIANPPETELIIDDIVIEAGLSVSLSPSINLNGKEIPLTYKFTGENVSIENYVLTGIGENTETTVTVTGKGVRGTFKVRVTEKASYKYVVVIGVDGAGAYFQKADTPGIDAIFANGAITYNCLTSDPTISAECWGSLLHGVVPSVHGLTNSVVSSTPYPSGSKYPSFFRVIRENDPNASLASFCNWNPINVGIVEDGIGVYKVGGMADSALTNEILAYLKNNSPTAMFVQFDEADGTGHSQGYGSDAQLAKISEIDGYIAKIYEAYREKGILDQTLFIVTADHGGSGKNHGGLTDTEKYVMFAAAGKNVENGTIGEMEIRDTASIVLHALGYESPETWTARVPSGLFEGVIATERPEYVDKDSDRYHETEPTPEKDTAGYVTNYVTDHNLTTYITFDGSVADNCGGTVTENGKLYYIDGGYYGQAAKLDDGYASIKNQYVGTGSFTVSFWIKTSGVNSDPCVVSNKNWDTGKNQGFAISIRSGNDIRLNIGDGYNRVDCDVALPTDYKQGWMHVVAIVDRENNKIGISVDFGAVVWVDIPEALQGDSYDASYDCINIGQDGTGKYNVALSASLDELMIFEGAFDQSDIGALAEYYGKN